MSSTLLIGGFASIAVLALADPINLVHRSKEHQFVVEIGPFDLPMSEMTGDAMDHSHSHTGTEAADHHSSMLLPPVGQLRIPEDGYLNGFTVQVTDAAGKTLPTGLIHHVNLIDPSHRELFLPISQRMLAIGKETGSHKLPGMLMGYPVRQGQPMVVAAMLHNPYGESFSQVTVRIALSYSPANRPWPLVRVFPFQLDVAFPYGDKSFDLPPGRSEKYYDASPAVAGRIMFLSGHVHEYADALTLTDLTTGAVLWSGSPNVDSGGTVQSMPVGRFYRKLGLKLDPGHHYRVSVSYDNPTGQSISAGGMGVVGGVFMPALGSVWPVSDKSDSLYQKDRAHYMQQLVTRGMM